MDVSVSGYYKWKAGLRQEAPPRVRKLVPEQVIINEMYQFRKKHRFTPGVRQFHAYLRTRGLAVTVKRLRPLLRSNGFIGYRRRCRVKTTDSGHNMSTYPNVLKREFHSGQLNKARCSDITYLPTLEGFVYLLCNIDIGSRRLIGWPLDTTMTVISAEGAYDGILQSRSGQVTRNNFPLRPRLSVLCAPVPKRPSRRSNDHKHE